MPLENKYNNYLIEDFLTDDDFIQWVSTGNSEFDKWLDLNNDKLDVVAKARSIVEELNTQVKDPDQSVQREVWSKIDQTIEGQSSQKKSNIRWIIPVAAAACAIFVLWFSIRDLAMVEIETGEKERQELLLVDNSKVISNENSTLSYKEKDFENNRSVYLSGEAFFEVTPGNQFTVETDFGTVSVLGTSFNVLARENSIFVECYTGKVQVADKEGNSVILVPGEKTVNSLESGITKEKVVLQKKLPQWIKAIKNYNSTSLDIVSKEIQEFYSIPVLIDPEVNEKFVSGNFSFGPIDATLQTITWPLNLDYIIKNDTIRIHLRE